MWISKTCGRWWARKDSNCKTTKTDDWLQFCVLHHILPILDRIEDILDAVNERWSWEDRCILDLVSSQDSWEGLINVFQVIHSVFFQVAGNATPGFVRQHLGKDVMMSDGLSHSTIHRNFEFIAKDRTWGQHDPRVHGITKGWWIRLHNVETLRNNVQLREQVSSPFFDLTVVQNTLDVLRNGTWVFITDFDVKLVIEAKSVQECSPAWPSDIGL